jgi:ribose transport system substrate-binding protein
VLRRKRSTGAVVLVLALALLAAACGSSKKSTTASGNTTTTSTGGQTSATDLYKFTGTTPPTDAPTPTKGKNVWIISCGQHASGCSGAVAQIKEAGEAIGWKMTVFDGNFNVADGYGNGIRQALAGGADAIELHGVDCALVTAPLREAKAKNVPVVTDASFDCNDPKNKPVGESLYTASLLLNKDYPDYGAWLKARGKATGEYIIQQTQGKAQIIDEHFEGQLLGDYQHDGIMEALSACAGCKVVADVPVTNADLAAGADKQKLAAAAVKAPNANVISYAFSSMAISGQMSSVVAQMGHDVLVVGGEGQVANLDLIRSGGVVDAEIAFPVGWLSYGVIDEMNRILNKQPAVPEGVGWAIVDKGHNLGNKGEEYKPPVDYKAEYKKAWGV